MLVAVVFFLLIEIDVNRLVKNVVTDVDVVIDILNVVVVALEFCYLLLMKLWLLLLFCIGRSPCSISS